MPHLRSLNKKDGFSLVEVMIAVAIIAIVCAMAIPNFNRMRENTYRGECISNLKRISASKELWSIDNRATDTDTPTSAQLDPYIKDGTAALSCPLDASSSFVTSYNINEIKTAPDCKIDASHILP